MYLSPTPLIHDFAAGDDLAAQKGITGFGEMLSGAGWAKLKIKPKMTGERDNINDGDGQPNNDVKNSAGGEDKRPVEQVKEPREFIGPDSTQVANLRRLDVNDVNAEFTSRGQSAPYDRRVDVREFEAASDLNFVRVHNAENPRGAWMVRPDEITGMTPAQIQKHLALPEIPTHVQDIAVPTGHTLRAGRVGPQKEWGAPNPSATQYQSPSFLPDSAFGPSREITQ